MDQTINSRDFIHYENKSLGLSAHDSEINGINKKKKRTGSFNDQNLSLDHSKKVLKEKKIEKNTKKHVTQKNSTKPENQKKPKSDSEQNQNNTCFHDLANSETFQESSYNNHFKKLTKKSDNYKNRAKETVNVLPNDNYYKNLTEFNSSESEEELINENESVITKQKFEITQTSKNKKKSLNIRDTEHKSNKKNIIVKSEDPLFSKNFDNSKSNNSILESNKMSKKRLNFNLTEEKNISKNTKNETRPEKKFEFSLEFIPLNLNAIEILKLRTYFEIWFESFRNFTEKQKTMFTSTMLFFLIKNKISEFESEIIELFIKFFEHHKREQKSFEFFLSFLLSLQDFKFKLKNEYLFLLNLDNIFNNSEEMINIRNFIQNYLEILKNRELETFRSLLPIYRLIVKKVKKEDLEQFMCTGIKHYSCFCNLRIYQEDKFLLLSDLLNHIE